MNCSLGNYYEICLSNYHWFPLPHGCPHILRSLKSSVNASLCCGWLRAKPEPSIGAHFTRGRSARAGVCAAQSAGQEVANTGGSWGAQDVANKNLVITFGSKPIIQPGSYMTFRSRGDHTWQQNEKMHETLFLKTLPLCIILFKPAEHCKEDTTSPLGIFS